MTLWRPRHPFPIVRPSVRHGASLAGGRFHAGRPYLFGAYTALISAYGASFAAALRAYLPADVAVDPPRPARVVMPRQPNP